MAVGVAVAAVAAPLTWLVITLQQRYRKANYRVREELSQLNADLQENLQGLEVVQMFRRERLNSERFGSTNALYRKAVNGTIFFDSSISRCWSGCHWRLWRWCLPWAAAWCQPKPWAWGCSPPSSCMPSGCLIP